MPRQTRLKHFLLQLILRSGCIQLTCLDISERVWRHARYPYEVFGLTRLVTDITSLQVDVLVLWQSAMLGETTFGATYTMYNFSFS